MIWTAIIGESGTQKSPAFNLVTKPIKELQYNHVQRHEIAHQGYEQAMVEYNRELGHWKKKQSGEPPTKPDAPVMKRLMVSDTTIEALATILMNNPRGVLVATDELAGWLGSFDKYSGGSGDSARWLSMYNADSIVKDRVSADKKTIFVRSAATSITGGIQPGVFARLVGQEHRESGLAARLLLCCPPRIPKRWADDTVSADLLQAYSELLDDLYKLDFDANGDPICIGLSVEAKKIYRQFYNAHGGESYERTGDLAAAFSKLEEHPLRIALILHCCQRRDGAVQADTMKAAITLVQWFKYETLRVYKLVSELPQDRQMRNLVEWIETKHCGIVTPRDVQRGRWKIKTAGQAEKALMNLVEMDYGKWAPGKRHFHTTRRIDIDTTNKKPR